MTPRRSGKILHVGVNLCWLVPGVVGGSEEYTTRLLRAVRDASPRDVRLTLFGLESFAEAHPDLVEAFDTELVGIDGRSRARRVAAEATWLATQARRRGVDLLHHAGGIAPPDPRAGQPPVVLTVHDLQPLLHPANFSAVKRHWIATMLPRSARRAALVLTPSDPASRSVVDHLGLAPERVVTVPHGIEAPTPVPARVVEQVRRRYRIDGASILYPAITYPHKDHQTLVKAFAGLTATRPDLTLVLTGGPGPGEAEVAAAIGRAGVGDRVRRTGRIPWSDLHALYAAATVVAVPSRFEGFGAPALEAMAAGTALVAADATALPWVVGEGGLLVPPGDVEAWRDALARVLDDPAERSAMVARGLDRAGTFSWRRSAGALLDGYRLAAAATATG